MPETQEETDVKPDEELSQEELELDQSEQDDSSASPSVESDSDEARDEQKPDGSQEEEESEKPEDDSSDHLKKALSKERYLRKRERDSRKKLEEENERLKKSIPSPDSTASQDKPAPKPPRLSDPDIDYDEDKYQARWSEYTDSLIDSKIDSREKRKREHEMLDDLKTRQETYSDKLSDYTAENPEFAELYEEAGRPSFSPMVEDALMASELGPQIEHHLYGNVDVLEEINSSSPAVAIRRLVQIENEISEKNSKSGEATRPKEASEAPRPISTEKGSSLAKDTFLAKFPHAVIKRSSA